MHLRTIAVRVGVPAGIFVGLILTNGARAAEGGAEFYLLGSKGSAAGILPPAEEYFQNDVYIYSGDP